ncbi:MAG: chaperone modulator CbpM [Bacteroidota bacterium]
MKEEYIAITKLSGFYHVEVDFFSRLDELGLIEITTIDKVLCIHNDQIHDLERMLRLHQELDINLEGIDTIFNLLEKIENLEAELNEAKNKLRFYEGSRENEP